MATKPQPIPAGYEPATPYLCCRNAAAAIDFYRKAFGATETTRFAEPGGRIGHAEIRIGTARVMLADEYPEFGGLSPQSLGGSAVSVHLYVEDVDALVSRAAAAGAKVLQPAADQFYGDRTSKIEDPFGHIWHLATRKENVRADEMERRFAAMMKQQDGVPAPPVHPIRPGFHTITPYLIVPDADKLIDFLKRAFGATETFGSPGGAGGIHIELRVGDSMLMVGGKADATPAPVTMYLYVPNVDAVYKRAVEAGGMSVAEPANQPYGDRHGGVRDAFGNTWYIASHVK